MVVCLLLSQNKAVCIHEKNSATVWLTDVFLMVFGHELYGTKE